MIEAARVTNIDMVKAREGMQGNGVVTGEGVKLFRLHALRSALRLEAAGLGRRGRSAYSIVKEEFGFKGNKARVLSQLNAYLDGLN